MQLQQSAAGRRASPGSVGSAIPATDYKPLGIVYARDETQHARLGGYI